MCHLVAKYTNIDLILPTTADRFFTTSSFLNRTILSPISLNTFSRRSSSSFCKSWTLPSASMTSNDLLPSKPNTQLTRL
ncbi:MAG: hypothetical protein M5U11_03035 [Anaerolineales bacterium]|nr:hypothetical protein [Anaerolineales bacterium]MDX9935645.1 hypothetical protein [Anaerolineales bacterium]WKZ54033.1 MAG: hypothetical protein QY324_14555 [Anaerolineales bacterium]